MYFSSCLLTSYALNYCLQMIRLVDSDFTPTSEDPEPRDYDCSLLSRLNASENEVSRQFRAESISVNHLNISSIYFQPYVNPLSGLLPFEPMKKALYEQLAVEEAIDVNIESILPPPYVTSNVQSAVSSPDLRSRRLR